uniref:Uncharacterized protein n=1 Tax=Avena sativa TaxID=4498 RepID=A0ACD5X2T9_AVESA
MRINRHPEQDILINCPLGGLQLEIASSATRSSEGLSSPDTYLQEPVHSLLQSMAGICYGSRKLCELLQEQQEPFLPHHGAATEQRCSVAGRKSTWGRGVRRALRRWDDLAGCFPCAARQSLFRRLPRAGDTVGSRCRSVETELDDDGGRQLSPVSVLDVLRCYSDEESSSSTALSHWEEEKDALRPSTSGTSSPPPNVQDDLLTGAATYRCYPADDRTETRAAEARTTGIGNGKQRKSTEEEQQKTISSWERIASDIARVSVLAELDLSSSGSAAEWRRFGVREEAWVGVSIEAMIFEEVRAEAVRDLLSLRA